MFTYIILIIAIVIIATLSIGCYNLTVQSELLEDELLFYYNKLEEIRKVVLETEIQLKEIDLRGSFEADDEVGFTFKNIKSLSEDLTKTIESIYEYRDTE
jgi:hypothetical protein